MQGKKKDKNHARVVFVRMNSRSLANIDLQRSVARTHDHTPTRGRALAKSEASVYGRDFVDVEVLIAFFQRQVAGDARAGEIEQKVNVNGVDLND
jgi:hypothetical protein